ncbi:MAG: amidase [Alphaproteobacteria bacterium]|nr:amidase [Alphaproteobacteria bacterium]MBV8409538.1 amidase [Alphaproteobacteria bacterium]
MTDYSRASLTETAGAIAAGRTTSRDVVEACLDRIARLNGTLNCFVEVDWDGAREAADAADRKQREGAPLGPLHGVPLAHKDMYYRTGRVSACGSRLREHWAPSATATALQRLDGAGAIELGRLVMVEFAMGPHGYNQNYPHCRNPWNPQHIPCGSSSGSGVAVGSRMAHASLGSDTGGSIRCPAAVSGVVGLLPTNGRVSRHGAMPMSHSLDAVGPLARTARDCARLLGVIAGADPADASSLDLPVPDYEAGLSSEQPLPTIGLARGYFDTGVGPDVAGALEQAARELRRMGFRIEEIAMPADLLDEIAELHPLVMKAEGAANHLPTMREREADYTFEVGHRLHAGFFIPAASYIRALKLRGPFLRAFAQAVFSKVDMVLTPVLPIPVPTIAETSGRTGKAYLDMVVSLTRNTKVINYLGLPAVSVPCGFTANGLPTAFQLVGQPLAEGDLLRVAHRYQEGTDWHTKEPELA